MIALLALHNTKTLLFRRSSQVHSTPVSIANLNRMVALNVRTIGPNTFPEELARPAYLPVLVSPEFSR